MNGRTEPALALEPPQGHADRLATTRSLALELKFHAGTAANSLKADARVLLSTSRSLANQVSGTNLEADQSRRCTTYLFSSAARAQLRCVLSARGAISDLDLGRSRSAHDHLRTTCGRARTRVRAERLGSDSRARRDDARPDGDCCNRWPLACIVPELRLSALSGSTLRGRRACSANTMQSRGVACSNRADTRGRCTGEASARRLSKFSVLAVSSSSHLRAFFILERASPLSPLSVSVSLASPSSSLFHGEPTISALQVRARDSSAFFPPFPPSAPSIPDNRTILRSLPPHCPRDCRRPLFRDIVPSILFRVSPCVPWGTLAGRQSRG